MKIFGSKNLMTIVTSDGETFRVKEGHITELENALKIIKGLKEYDTLDKLELDLTGPIDPVFISDRGGN